MSATQGDLYAILGVTADISDGDLRRVYRALVKRHHPDHNGGSPESAARFAQIQDAYVRLARLRNSPNTAVPPAQTVRVAAEEDAGIEGRIANLERELAAARAAERRRRPAGAAREAAARGAYQQPARATQERLGYYETDDSFTSIIDDAAAALGDRVKSSRRSEFTRRLTDLFGGSSEG